MEVFYVLGGMIILAAIVGLYNLFFCCKPNPVENFVSKEFAEQQEKVKNEIEAKRLENESRLRAEKEVEEFLKNNPDKYKFVVTLKDGVEFESEEFETKAKVSWHHQGQLGSYPSNVYYSLFYAQCFSAKEQAENASKGYMFKHDYDYNRGYPVSGFLKVGSVEINVNEILLKEIKKV